MVVLGGGAVSYERSAPVLLSTECDKKAAGLTRNPGDGVPKYRYLARDTGGIPPKGYDTNDDTKTDAPNRAGQEAAARQYRGSSLKIKRPSPYDPPRTLGIGYGRVLGGCVFL